MILNKKLLGILDIASKDLVRPALNSIYIKDGKAVATDGYVLMIVQLSDPTIQQELPEVAESKYVEVKEALIRTVDLKRILKNLPRKMSLPILENVWTIRENETTLTFALTDLETAIETTVKKVDAEFPSYEKIIPQKLDDEKKVSFDVDKMIAMLTAFKKTGIGSAGSPITITVRDERSPVVLTAKDHDQKEIYGLIMPIRNVE